jgi:hypothetical protein
VDLYITMTILYNSGEWDSVQLELHILKFCLPAERVMQQLELMRWWCQINLYCGPLWRQRNGSWAGLLIRSLDSWEDVCQLIKIR